MTTKFLYDFIARHRYGVMATVSSENKSESALVGIAVAPDLKVFFDTTSRSRKHKNLLGNPSISIVIGWENEQTIQYEGVAEIPNQRELGKLKELYFTTFPDGREREKWKDIVYYICKPTWVRYSDFNEPIKIEEISF